VADLSLSIVARDGASRVIKGVGDHAEATRSKISAFGGIAKQALGVAAAGGVAALGAAMFQGVKDAQSYQTLAAQTTAVLKSTGNAAGTSVGHVQALAGKLETLSGVDEELIIHSQNVLATFTDIHNQVGKGNAIFDRATKASLNLSTAMNGDLQGASVQVGKALNDPIKGVTALSKVGVSFTDGQRKQIKAMVDSGNKMGAQKVILHELNKEFGGAAKAAGSGFGGALAHLQDTVGDTFRDVGMKLLPVLTKVTNWASASIPKIVAGVNHFGQAWGGKGGDDWISKTAQTLHSIWDAMAAGAKWIQQNKTLVESLAVGVGAMVAAWEAYQLVLKVAAVVQAAFNIVMDANPIGLVILALVALAAGLVFAYKHSETFRKVVDGAMHGAGAAIHWVVEKAGQVWGWLKGHWPLLLAILTGPIGLAVLFIHDHWNSLVAYFKAAPGRIHGALSGMWSGLKDGFRAAINWIISGWNNLSFGIPGFTIAGQHIPAVTIGTPNIPYLAKGGIVRARAGGTLAVLGEAGRDEAVIPLTGSRHGASMLGGGGTLNVTVNVGAGADPRQTAAWLDEVFRQAEAHGFRPSTLQTA
jgi:hypothetical protein